MASLCLGIATSHTAMITRQPQVGNKAQVQNILGGFGELAAAFQAAKPDIVLLFSSDHVNKFFLDNMPAFCIGVSESFDGPVEANIGVPTRTFPSAPDFARAILSRGLDEGVDWSFAEDWRLDHGAIVPLNFINPAGKVPVVPVNINCSAPPYPSLRRCYVVGEWLAATLEKLPSDTRVALLAAGGLSHSPGGRKMGFVDEAFDRRFLGRLASGNRDMVLATTDDEVENAGSSTAEIRSWFVVAGAFHGRPMRTVVYEPMQEYGTGWGQCLVTV